MTVARSFAKNALFKTLGEIAIRLLSFAFVVYVARDVGDEKFGGLNFAFSFALLFVVIVDFGLNPLLVRDAARDIRKSTQLFFNFLIIKLGLALLFAAAVLVGLRLVSPDPVMTKMAYWMAGFVMLNSFTEFMNAVFHAHQKMQYEAITMSIQKLGLLIFGLYALWIGWDIMGVAAAYTCAGALGVLVGTVILWRGKFVQGRWTLDKTLMRYALRQALPLTLTTLFINLYFRIDITLLTKLRSAEEVGWYSAAHKCIEVLMVVPAILVVASFPGFAKLFVENREKLIRAAVKVLRLLLMLGMPIAGGALLLGTPLMTLLFGNEYAASGKALAWLSVALCFIFINYALSYLLISGEKQKVNAVVSGLAVLVSVGSNLWLIPKLGYEGAAVSAAVTELFLLLSYAVAVNRLLFRLPLFKPLLRVSAATGVMLGVLWTIRHIHPLLAIVAGGTVYLLALWLVGAVEQEDVALIKKMIKGSEA